jgi:hypothetical protein
VAGVGENLKFWKSGILAIWADDGVSFSDFQFFSFPAPVGTVKTWPRPDPQISPVKPGSAARTPASGPEWPALRRSRHGHDATLGGPSRSADGDSGVGSVNFQSPQMRNSLNPIGIPVLNVPILGLHGREGSG